MFPRGPGGRWFACSLPSVAWQTHPEKMGEDGAEGVGLRPPAPGRCLNLGIRPSPSAEAGLGAGLTRCL